MNLGRETAFATAARFSMALLGFAGTVAFARLLGQTSFGGYYFLFAVAKLLNRPVIGGAIAGKKRISESGSKPDEIIGSVGLFLLVWCVLSALVLFPFSRALSEFFNVGHAGLLLIALLVSESTFEAADWLVQGRGKIAVTTWVDFFRSLLTFPGQLILVLLGYGVLGMVFGLTIASLLTAIPLFYILSTKPALPTAQTVRSLWQFSRYSIPATFIGEFSARIDVLLLGVILGPAAVANYEVAAKLTVAAVFLSETSSNGLMTRLSLISSQSGEVSQHITNTLKFSALFAIPVLLGGALIARPLMVTIFGNEYASAATLLVPMATFRLIESQNLILKRTMEGIDNPRTVIFADVIGAVTNLVLGIVLIFSIGTVGVILSTIVGEIIRYILLVRAVRERTNASLFNSQQLYQVISGLTMLFTLLIITRFVNIWKPSELFAIIIAGAVIYATSLLLMSSELRLRSKELVQRNS